MKVQKMEELEEQLRLAKAEVGAGGYSGSKKGATKAGNGAMGDDGLAGDNGARGKAKATPKPTASSSSNKKVVVNKGKETVKAPALKLKVAGKDKAEAPMAGGSKRKVCLLSRSLTYET